FESKSLPWRALVISAGVIMNMLFAFVVFSISAGVWGVPEDPPARLGGVAEDLLTEEAAALTAIEPGARVTAVNDEPVVTIRDLRLALTRARAGETTLSFDNAPDLTFVLPSNDEEKGSVIAALEPAYSMPPVLETVQADGPGAQAGLEPGDSVMSVGGRPIATWQEFVYIIERNAGSPTPVVVQRAGQPVELSVTPAARTLDSGIVVGRIDVGVTLRPGADPLT